MLSVVAVSKTQEHTYLIDCGNGWGCVYHGGEWIEEPHRLAVLLADDVPRSDRRGPWITRFSVLETEVLTQAERALRKADLRIRDRFASLGLA
jgi:hypothetical protein